MTSPSDDSTTASSLHLSPHELSRLIIDPRMYEQICQTFLPDPLHTAVLRYYNYVSRTIDRLEKELEFHRREQHVIFDHLLASPTFPTLIQPIVQEYRHGTYGHSLSPPRTPSDNNSVEPPSSYQISPEEALVRIPTPDNVGPIVVSGDEKGEMEQKPVGIGKTRKRKAANQMTRGINTHSRHRRFEKTRGVPKYLPGTGDASH
jgi:hypothetical protein